MTYDAQYLANCLGTLPPTPEQQAMIEADCGPVVIVAGAGSGKTETMAARVVWAVANGHARPDQVLGLTFTRKATAELAERLRKRLHGLNAAGLTDQDGLNALTAGPTIATYHSYAHNLVTEHGLRIGLEPGAALLSTAGALALADGIVQNYQGDLSELSLSRTAVAPALVDLNAAMSEHLLTPTDLANHAEETLNTWHALPLNAKGGHFSAPPKGADAQKTYAALRSRILLRPLLETFAEQKRHHNVVDFGDLLHLAVHLAKTCPEVITTERDRYSFILLDEFQDTSYGQLALLKTLFGQGQAVTAVGDPHQAIYGWRGASAANLALFQREFTGGGRTPTTLQLSTSWRNDHAILRAANALTAPLNHTSSVPVTALNPSPKSGPGHVHTHWYAHLIDEHHDTAQWCHDHWTQNHSVAILCRTRSHFEPLTEALTKLGVPVDCVGGGGLLDTPEIQDILAVLHTLNDPHNGPALARILTYSRYHVTAQDLHALHAWSRHHHNTETAVQEAALNTLPTPQSATSAVPHMRSVSLVAGLDALPEVDWVGTSGETFTTAGYRRLATLRDALRQLRRAVSWPLPELVTEIIRTLGVDLDVIAQPGQDPIAGAAQLAEFRAQIQNYVAAAPTPTLSGLMQWLTYAQTHDRGLSTSDVEPEAVRADQVGVVTICTVHAAKGLEWDAVAVVDLAKNRFPSKPKVNAPDVRTPQAIPNSLRGDRDELPQWSLTQVEHAGEVNKSLQGHIAAMNDDAELSERRLAYVALTRARHALWLSGSRWHQNTPPANERSYREPSDYLTSARAALLGQECLSSAGFADDEDAEPLGTGALSQASAEVWWPQPAPDNVIEQGVVAVQTALTQPPESDPDDPVTDQINTILADRKAQAAAQRAVHLGDHLSASHLVALASDLKGFGLRTRRPIPTEPRPAAHRGTQFHTWIEHYFSGADLLAPMAVPGADDLESPPELGELTQQFLSSEWAQCTPEALEVPVEFTVGQVVIRGRIDAVFRDDAGFILVDWKSGRPPQGVAAEHAALQLAAYRLAWQQIHHDQDHVVRAAYFYAATGQTVWVDPIGEETLHRLLKSAEGLTTADR